MTVIEDSANNLYIVVESNDPDLAHLYMGVPAKRCTREETRRIGYPFVPKAAPGKTKSRLIRRAGTRIVFEKQDHLMPITTRVRILVAVDDKGHWVAAGYNIGGKNDPHEWIAIDDLTEVIRYHWIEADVPLPEPETTIIGDVKGE